MTTTDTDTDTNSADTDVGQRMDWIREELRTIANDPDVRHRIELRESMLAHMALAAVREDLSCPTCEASVKELRWTCCGHSTASARTLAKDIMSAFKPMSVSNTLIFPTHGIRGALEPKRHTAVDQASRARACVACVSV